MLGEFMNLIKGRTPFLESETIWEPTPNVDQKKVIDEEEKVAAAKLEAKRRAAIAYLGTKWIVHPDNIKKNKDLPPNTLGKNTA